MQTAVREVAGAGKRRADPVEGERRVGADGRTQVLTRADAGWLKWVTLRAPRGQGRPKPRKCPAEPASEFRAGTRRLGADGATWVATTLPSRKKRWVREAGAAPRARPAAKPGKRPRGPGPKLSGRRARITRTV
jgi:hypothetical protein